MKIFMKQKARNLAYTHTKYFIPISKSCRRSDLPHIDGIHFIHRRVQLITIKMTLRIGDKPEPIGEFGRWAKYTE